MTNPDNAPDPGRFRRTLIRVMTVQVIALIVLWLVERAYTP